MKLSVCSPRWCGLAGLRRAEQAAFRRFPLGGGSFETERRVGEIDGGE
jgi:hypothetical protein